MVMDINFVKNVLFGAHLRWDADPDQFLRLRTTYEGEWLYLKINPTFPDGPAYFFVLPGGQDVEFDEFPPGWSRGPLKWPDSAKRE